MTYKIPITVEETNKEILARMIKATARKFNCSMVIDFRDGNRTIEFVGDEAFKPQIIEELKTIFKKRDKS